MGSGAPLLNEYKQDFFWKRFPQTVLGGPKLRLGYDAPPYVYLNQVLLFLMPWVLGGICTILVEYAIISYDVGLYLCGAFVAVFALTVNIISAVVQGRKNAVSNSSHIQNVLAEDDEINFMSCCGAQTVRFVIPGKKYKINIIIHSIVSGITCALGMWYLLPQTLNTLFYNSMAATVLVYFFGWIVVCIVLYSLVIGPPPECATFRSHDPYEILQPLSRPFYVMLFCCVDILARHWSSFLLTNQILHVVFVFLPLLWMAGMLPPLDALLLWASEQALVILFGGSPMASDLRLLVLLFSSAAVYVAVCFIPLGFHSVVIMAAFGYLLSIDLGSLGNQLLALCKRQKPDEFGHLSQSFLWHWGIKEVVFHLLMLILTGSIAFAVNYMTKDFTTIVTSYLGYAAIVLCVLERLLSQLQTVYIMFGLWRNKLYPSSVQRTTIFTKSKRRLAILGYIRRAVFNFVSPILLLVYLSASIHFTTVSSALSNTTSVPPTAASLLGANRAFRWVWQNTRASLLEISVIHLVSLVLPSSVTAWTNLGLGLQLLIASLVRNRLAQFFGKLYFFFTILITSWTDKKQRRKSTAPTIAANLLFFPLVMAVIAIAAALSAPLMPLFTLPLILIGFPRPLRSWPGEVGGSANKCADTMFYEHLAPQLALAIRHAFAMGSIGFPSPGRIILVRFQDRMAWVQVLESGYVFCTLSIKGLELQETSCHTVEATRVEDIFEIAFEKEGGFSCCALNKYPLCILHPCDAAIVKTYSDAKNQLTGVIDSPESLQNVVSGFWRTLTWVMLHHIDQRKKEGKLGGARPKSAPSISSQKSWHKLDDDNGSHSSKEKLMSVRKLSPINNKVSPVKSNELDEWPDDAEDLSLRGSWDGKKRGSKKRPGSSHSRKSLSDSIWSSESLALEPLDNKKSNKISLVSGSRHMAPKGPGTVLPPVNGGHKPHPFIGNTKDRLGNKDLFGDLDFGLPVADVNKTSKLADNPLFSHPNTTNTINVKPTTVGTTSLASSTLFSSPHSKRLSPPLHWRDIPIDSGTLSDLLVGFSPEWYKHVIKTLKLEADDGEKNETASEVCSDPVLQDVFAKLITACHAVVNVLGFSGSDAVSMGTNHVHRVYSGDIPWSLASHWITDDPEFLAVVLKAYRYAVKLAIDQMLLGEVSSNEELEEYLSEYDREWYIGVETDPQWGSSIHEGKPTLFSFSHDPVQSTYNSRVLTCQDMSVYMGELSWEAVRGQWANLSLELLYLTNDDEERYSIQAHPTLLRNLTVQAADPPLGYPIYSSRPVMIPTL